MMAQQKLKKKYSKIQKFEIREKPHVCHNCMFIFPISRLIRHDLFRHVFAGWMAIDPKWTNKMSSHISVRATIPCEDPYMNIITFLDHRSLNCVPSMCFLKTGPFFRQEFSLRKRPKGNVRSGSAGRNDWRDEIWSHDFYHGIVGCADFWWAFIFAVWMSGWPVDLILNDEQMSNKVRVDVDSISYQQASLA